MQIQILATLSAFVWSSIASAASTAVLQPVDNWGLDAGSTQCTAARSFGSTSDPIVLGIVPSISGSSYQLLVSIQREGPAFAKNGRGTVDFGTGPTESGVLYFGSKGVRMSVYQYRISAAQMGQAEGAFSVSVQMERGDSYSFALTQMPALLDALHKCTADLQGYWNLDGKKNIKAAERPMKDIRSLLTINDYPTEAAKLLKQQQHDIAQYQLLVDERGAVAGCDVLVTSGAPVVDVTACDVIKQRAKFTPAMDSQGKSVRSVWTTVPIGWSTGKNALDGGCTMVSSDSNTLLNTCGRIPGDQIQPMRPTPPATASPGK